MKELLKYFGLIKEPVHIFTQETENDKENQILTVKCFRDGEYTHTVKLSYFTKEQAEKLEQAKRDMGYYD